MSHLKTIQSNEHNANFPLTNYWWLSPLSQPSPSPILTLSSLLLIHLAAPAACCLQLPVPASNRRLLHHQHHPQSTLSHNDVAQLEVAERSISHLPARMRHFIGNGMEEPRRCGFVWKHSRSRTRALFFFPYAASSWRSPPLAAPFCVYQPDVALSE